MKNAYAIGSKIYLRAPTMEDAKGAWHEWFSDHEITKYLVDRYLPNSKEAQIEFFESLLHSKDRVVFSICKVDDDEHIGVCGLSSINWFHGYADQTYVIGKTQPDNGVVIAEVVKLLLEVAFMRLNLSNLRSIYAGRNSITPVIDKMFGYKTVGKLTKFIICDGEIDDMVIMQLSKEDWILRNSCK